MTDWPDDYFAAFRALTLQDKTGLLTGMTLVFDSTTLMLICHIFDFPADGSINKI